jgi:putative DNA primase/helicase
MNSEFVPDASYANFLTFVDSLFVYDEDQLEKARLLQEWLGYLLMYDYRLLKKMLFLYGPRANNGKSSLLKIICAVMGEDYFSSVQLNQLKDFMVFNLYGKHANLVGDEKVKVEIDDGILKQLVGEYDLITANRKYRDPFQFVNRARLIFAVNKLPQAHSKDKGYFTRITILEFLNEFLDRPDPKDSRQLKADPDLIEYIIEHEKSGVLNWMLEGLSRFLRNKKMTIPRSCEKALEIYKKRFNSVVQFVDECCSIDPASKPDRTIVYKKYEEWCKDNGHTRFNASNFYEKIEEIDGLELVRSGNARYIKGMKLEIPLFQ